MTPSRLKRAILTVHPNSYFFDRDSMEFFGDTMRNFGVRDGGTVRDYHGREYDTWELYRKRPVKYGLQSSTYFDKETLRQVYPVPQED